MNRNVIKIFLALGLLCYYTSARAKEVYQEDTCIYPMKDKDPIGKHKVDYTKKCKTEAKCR